MFIRDEHHLLRQNVRRGILNLFRSLVNNTLLEFIRHETDLLLVQLVARP